ncbi:MAG TPA: hypothetical protein VK581_07720, partial [Chthoniobacterales bacterium]|nr:hypothetical protein [Chthoniobacterales bacterium]
MSTKKEEPKGVTTPLHRRRKTRLRELALVAMPLLLLLSAAEGLAQSAIDGFDPNANGYVFSVVAQADGKILIGGDFTTISPNGGPAVTRNRIARLNRDGTLDTAFNPNANGTVLTIVVQPDGRILVGGNFTSIGGQARNRMARLDATSGAADSFNPDVSDKVWTIAVQADGKILAGGYFYRVGGQPRFYLARLDAITGAADESFNPDPNDFVYAIVVQPSGKILVGGSFYGAQSIGGESRNGVARLDPKTGLADSFDPNGTGGYVRCMATQADGKILLAGDFKSMGGEKRNRIARIDGETGLVDTFDPNANSYIMSLAVQPDGKILVGGTFLGANSIGGQLRRGIARLDPTTGLADSFDLDPNGPVISIALQADGKILTGGDFDHIAGQTRHCMARVDTNGRVDQTLDLATVGNFVLATAVQPDGKILIGGSFSTVLGVPRNNIARLNTDGTLDIAFDPNANNTVYSIALQADGKILAGGTFSGPNSIGGQTRNHIARLDATTGLADSFDPNVTSTVLCIAVQEDGKILVGGAFFGSNSVGSQTRNYIARLDAATGLADSFDPNA